MAPTLGTAALLGLPGSPAARLLAYRPLTWIGRISYSLYLWHWPLLAIARQRTTAPLGVGARIGLLAAAVVVSVVTFFVVEQPIRRSRLLARHRSATFALGAGLVLASAGYATYLRWYYRP
ncbi:MAG: hypothetical protein R2715_10880 [Ilumatobacteraceae bacterium]